MIKVTNYPNKGCSVEMHCDGRLPAIIQEAMEIIYSIGEAIRHEDGDIPAKIYWNMMKSGISDMIEKPFITTNMIVDVGAMKEADDDAD